MADSKEYTKLSTTEIQDEIAKREKELVLMRFSNKANQLKDTASITKTRKEIARLNTALNQK